MKRTASLFTRCQFFCLFLTEGWGIDVFGRLCSTSVHADERRPFAGLLVLSLGSSMEGDGRRSACVPQSPLRIGKSFPLGVLCDQAIINPLDMGAFPVRIRFSFRDDFRFPVMISMCMQHQPQVSSRKEDIREAQYHGSKVKNKIKIQLTLI